MKKTALNQKKSGKHEDKTKGENVVLNKITTMPEPYRTMGQRLHAIIKASSPSLSPKTWYGMPAYAKDGKVICFFRGVENERYMTLGFTDNSSLDEGNLWPTSFALKELTATEEAMITTLVKKAVK